MRVGRVSQPPESQPPRKEGFDNNHSKKIQAALDLTLKALLDGVLTSIKKDEAGQKRGSNALRKSIED